MRKKNSRKEERNRGKKIIRMNQNTSKRKAGRVEKEGRKVEGLKESKKSRELSRQDRKRRKMKGIKVFPDLLNYYMQRTSVLRAVIFFRNFLFLFWSISFSF